MIQAPLTAVRTGSHILALLLGTTLSGCSSPVKPATAEATPDGPAAARNAPSATAPDETVAAVEDDGETSAPPEFEDPAALDLDIEPQMESMLIDRRIQEIRDLLAADAIPPSATDPSGLWRFGEFTFIALRADSRGWTLVPLPSDPVLHIPRTEIVDWLTVTTEPIGTFSGRLQLDKELWFPANCTLLAHGDLFKVSCRGDNGEEFFDVDLERGLHADLRTILEAELDWLFERQRIVLDALTETAVPALPPARPYGRAILPAGGADDDAPEPHPEPIPQSSR